MICEYYANKQAWMIMILFQEYVQQHGRKINEKKIFLYVENYLSHPNIKLFSCHTI